MKRRGTLAVMVMTVLLATGCAIPTDLFPGGGTRGASTTDKSVIRKVRMCTAPEDKLCAEDRDTFSPSDPSISATAEVTNVTEGMIIIFTWKYLGGDPDVAPFTVGVTQAAAEQSQAVRPIVSAINKIDPQKDWASGDYVVEIKENTPGTEPVVREFRVK